MFVILVLVFLRKNRDNRLCINHKPAEIREYFIRVIIDAYMMYMIYIVLLIFTNITFYIHPIVLINCYKVK